ncbi:MAG: SMP-30/gluconolactonase/LRE family protein [Leptothrix ochracea]
MLCSAIRPVSRSCLLGESPFWHPIDQVLYWCDIPGQSLHRLDPVTEQEQAWQLPWEPGCVVPAAEGGLWVALRDGVHRFDPLVGQCVELLAAAPYDVRQERFNDGKCDPQGRFWVGTLYEPRDKLLASLYRLDPNGFKVCASDVTTANGLAWSVDGRTMYWSDTKAHRIDAFDVDPAAGAISRRRVFATFPLRHPEQSLETYGGRPDGAAMDQEGGYWVAMYEGARLLRLNASGHVTDEIALPVQCPTMLTFGGEDLRTLYVTTASYNRPAAELLAQPWAGRVLSMRVAVAGLAAPLARRL